MPKWIVGAAEAARTRPLHGATRSPVVLEGEGADPRVEQLDRVGARRHLAGDVAREGRGQLLEQGLPDLRGPEHEPLRLVHLAARASLDEVARDGERRTAEADDRLVGPQRGADEADRLVHVGELLGVGHPDPLDVRHRPDGFGDDRSDALDELDADVHPEERAS